MKKWALAFLLMDILTKAWAVQKLPHFQPGAYPFAGVGIFSMGGITFSLNYIENTGAAWGFFSGNSALLFAIRVLMILCLFLAVPKRFPIYLILAGAIGNAIDFCLYRHVIDFLHFTFWGYSFPVFNVADSCITIGILCLLLFPKSSKTAETV